MVEEGHTIAVSLLLRLGKIFGFRKCVGERRDGVGIARSEIASVDKSWPNMRCMALERLEAKGSAEETFSIC